MSATTHRDHAQNLAKSNPAKALVLARSNADPWFRAQALSWVARFAETDGEVLSITSEAARAAAECDNSYKRVAVRAWEVAALAERNLSKQARSILDAVLKESGLIVPLSSRAEALMLLLHAAIGIDGTSAAKVFRKLEGDCGNDTHWRCVRAVRNGAALLESKAPRRLFFW